MQHGVTWLTSREPQHIQLHQAIPVLHVRLGHWLAASCCVHAICISARHGSVSSKEKVVAQDPMPVSTAALITTWQARCHPS